MGDFTIILLPVALIAVMYFTSIRPENKRRKEADAMREALKVGDEVTTIGGILGKIVSISSDFVVFETGADRVRIQVVKSAIARVGRDKE